jgi:hypothetical protein
MSWQDVAVFAVVGAAVLFLAGRNVDLRRRRKKPAETFIPLASLRQSAPPDRDDAPSCH